MVVEKIKGKPNYDLMKEMFQYVNSRFLSKEKALLYDNVSERSWYGHFCRYFYSARRKYGIDKCYKADIEYNRNKGMLKAILDDTHDLKPINIVCDVILHSRGTNIEQDNLICIEMKKSTEPKEDKEADKNRVRILTKDSFDGVWSYDGTALPEYVCRYILGVYYEVNIKKSEIYIEYYNKGKLVETEIIKY